MIINQQTQGDACSETGQRQKFGCCWSSDRDSMSGNPINPFSYFDFQASGDWETFIFENYDGDESAFWEQFDQLNGWGTDGVVSLGAFILNSGWDINADLSGTTDGGEGTSVLCVASKVNAYHYDDSTGNYDFVKSLRITDVVWNDGYAWPQFNFIDTIKKPTGQVVNDEIQYEEISLVLLIDPSADEFPKNAWVVATDLDYPENAGGDGNEEI